MRQIDSGVFEHQCFAPLKDVCMQKTHSVCSQNPPPAFSEKTTSISSVAISRSRSVRSKISKYSDFSELQRTSSLEVNLSEMSFEDGSFKENVPYKSTSASSSLDNSMYRSADESKYVSISTSEKFLDWLTECFWKCSPGCQELPTAK